MFVGHGLVALALAGTAARLLGCSRERAASIGLAAALFGTLPDVDIVYAPVGLLGGVSGLAAAAEAFWETGNVVHRGPTHSLLVGAVGAVAAGLAARGTVAGRLTAVALCSGLVAVALTVSGLLGAVVVAVAAAVGGVLVGVARGFGLGPAAVAGAAAAGLLTHPFGDLVTGTPPALLYPLDAAVVSGRIVLSADPTLHLLGAFGIELAAIWAGVAVYARLTGRRLPALVDRRAALGLLYPAAAVAIPAPTLEAAAPFVLSVLAVGVVGVVPPPARALGRDADRPLALALPDGGRGPRDRLPGLDAVATGLAAVTLAGLAYGLTYAVLAGVGPV